MAWHWFFRRRCSNKQSVKADWSRCSSSSSCSWGWRCWPWWTWHRAGSKTTEKTAQVPVYNMRFALLELYLQHLSMVFMLIMMWCIYEHIDSLQCRQRQKRTDYLQRIDTDREAYIRKYTIQCSAFMLGWISKHSRACADCHLLSQGWTKPCTPASTK